MRVIFWVATVLVAGAGLTGVQAALQTSDQDPAQPMVEALAQVLRSGQQLCLEPMQRRCQRPTSIPALGRPDEPKRRVRRHAPRVVEVSL